MHTYSRERRKLKCPAPPRLCTYKGDTRIPGRKEKPGQTGKLSSLWMYSPMHTQFHQQTGEALLTQVLEHTLWPTTGWSLRNADPEKNPSRPGFKIKMRRKEINKALNHEGDRLCRFSPTKLLKKKKTCNNNPLGIKWIRIRFTTIHYLKCSVLNKNLRDMQRNRKMSPIPRAGRNCLGKGPNLDQQKKRD